MVLQKETQSFLVGIRQFEDICGIKEAELLSVGELLIDGFEFEFVAFLVETLGGLPEFLAVAHGLEFDLFLLILMVDLLDHQESVHLVEGLVSLVHVLMVVFLLQLDRPHWFSLHLL
jgi:hypothetical protein